MPCAPGCGATVTTRRRRSSGRRRPARRRPAIRWSTSPSRSCPGRSSRCASKAIRSPRRGAPSWCRWRARRPSTRTCSRTRCAGSSSSSTSRATGRRTVGYRRDATPGGLAVTFTVTAGEVFRIGRVDVEGIRALTPTDVATVLQASPGDIFVESTVDSQTAALRERYRRAGYRDVRIELVVEERDADAAGGAEGRPRRPRRRPADRRRRGAGQGRDGPPGRPRRRARGGPAAQADADDGRALLRAARRHRPRRALGRALRPRLRPRPRRLDGDAGRRADRRRHHLRRRARHAGAGRPHPRRRQPPHRHRDDRAGADA